MNKSHIVDMIEFISEHAKTLDQNDLVTQAKLKEISIFLVKLYELTIGHYGH